MTRVPSAPPLVWPQRPVSPPADRERVPGPPAGSPGCPHGDGPTRTCRTSLPVSPACLSWCPHPRENTPQHPHPTLPPLDTLQPAFPPEGSRAGLEQSHACPCGVAAPSPGSLRGSPALSGPGPFILMDPAPLARGAPPAPAHPALKILSANTAQEPMEMPMAGARGQLLASALWTRLSLWDLGAPSPCPHTPRKQHLRQSQAYQHPPRRVALAGSCPPQPGPQRPLPQNPRAQQTQ